MSSLFLLVYPVEHLEQPIEDADKLYNHNLASVLNFFASKLHLYYSSSRLALLLTFLSASEDNHLRTHFIPLPSRLKIADDNALGLQHAGGHYVKNCYWEIFQDFLDSSDPLALNERRYTIASLACLKVLFGHYQAPVLRFTWFNQHRRALRIRIEIRSQRHHRDLPVGTDWEGDIGLYWHLRTHLPTRRPHGIYLSNRTIHFEWRAIQYDCSKHLPFLLQKSAYSNNILNFARDRVFRFGYLHRKHPVHMKKAIFYLAKYIQRVTGETAEVRACESIWGRDRWLTGQ